MITELSGREAAPIAFIAYCVHEQSVSWGNSSSTVLHIKYIIALLEINTPDIKQLISQKVVTDFSVGSWINGGTDFEFLHAMKAILVLLSKQFNWIVTLSPLLNVNVKEPGY